MRSLELYSFVSGIDRFLEQTEQDLKNSDASLLDQEVKVRKMEQTMQQLQKELSEISRQLADGQQQKFAGVQRNKTLQDQKNMLLDLKGFLQGKLFKTSSEGAVFFTHDLSSFAYRIGTGELEILDSLRRASDAFIARIREQQYYFLQGHNGAYYFHA